MQRFIFKNKNYLMLINGIFIALGFLFKFAFENPLFPYSIFTFSFSFFEFFLILASLFGGIPIFLQAFSALRFKVVSIDLLVSIAVLGAFFIRNFEESAIVIFLFLFGAYLEQKTLNKTRSAVKDLIDMAPQWALKKMEDGEFQEVEVEDVEKGDILLVKTGDKIPVDGAVVFGKGSVNEASITGESLPVEKENHALVYAGTLLENGTIQVEAHKVGEDTTFGKIIELVEEAQDAKSEAERFIDRFAKYYTPFVLLAALVFFLFTENVETAVTILVLGCPGALVVGVPVSNVAGIGNGAKNGVLLKGSEVIHYFSKSDTLVFDKTGTLTLGKPQVSKVFYYYQNQPINLTKQTLEPPLASFFSLAHSYLASVEKESSHPLAKAVLGYLEQNQNFNPALSPLQFYPVLNTQVFQGGGIGANINQEEILVGNLALMKKQGVSLDLNLLKEAQSLEKQGNSMVLVAVNKNIVMLMGIKDQIRPEVKQQLNNLKKLGVKNLIMLSGDNQGTVDLVSQELGLTQAYGNMLPQDKSNFVKKLKEQGKIVTFVGDGINDSPSLALAHIGIAMGGGTDVAIETSEVVLMNSNFNHLTHALALAKATALNMKQNIVIALGVVLFLLLSLILSDWMNMSLGMLLHEGSILLVILNGMRLLRFRRKKYENR